MKKANTRTVAKSAKHSGRSEMVQKIEAKFRDRSARIGILGLGYVGLPLALEFCRKGFRVAGFDVSRKRVADIKRGRSYISDVPSSELAQCVKKGLLSAYDNFGALAAQDAVIICVQTPLRKTKEPDISYILATLREITAHMRRGQLIVLESTTYPGATEEIILPALEKDGPRLGQDFFLAFSPERVDPGNAHYQTANTPKVVGGADAASTRLAAALYEQVIEKVVPVSSTRTAEVVKLLENSFRAVNIALVNELALICHRLDIEAWEVIAAAATKPFGFMPFYPGPGIGGHCIPKDPQLLSWKMKTLNFDARFIQLASTINGSMPDYTVRRIADMLNGARKSLNGSRVLVLGAAYKPGISDYRESPSLDVMDLLLQKQAQVSYHDPYVPEAVLRTRTLRSVPLTDAALKAADCVVILTAHAGIDYGRIVRRARLVFDARNATKGLAAKNLQRL
ncbi:MAG: nucleotide sugar dehydrogenase [Elusimicrobiota bacterium]|jgi:UDP-N-acetyl-D-glucosamine dehydrogenase